MSGSTLLFGGSEVPLRASNQSKVVLLLLNYKCALALHSWQLLPSLPGAASHSFGVCMNSPPPPASVSEADPFCAPAVDALPSLVLGTKGSFHASQYSVHMFFPPPLFLIIISEWREETTVLR